MLEFCICGSLKVNGNCTNRKCAHHMSGMEPATYKQIEYIKDILDKLQDDTEYAFGNMAQKEANKLIVSLEERLEAGE